jgi:hypothetical protein
VRALATACASDTRLCVPRQTASQLVCVSDGALCAVWRRTVPLSQGGPLTEDDLILMIRVHVCLWAESASRRASRAGCEGGVEVSQTTECRVSSVP